ncbi:DUF4136 domain-containing protein [Polaribacter sp. MED152]|uniref:DUF4136 domain-containing protein n=1 Tax=Polaribacter sp. MED152 TaxID=313598 RepID=UPI000068C792|nr:DUF4136 domain-containing protein [Polaribacter sp. MED152]EAQ42450.1 hypothetical protein MED152_07010 [Polaribacter sp. MED152]
MAKTKLVILSLIIILVSSCGSVKTASDFDSSVDFTKFKTFGFAKESNNLKINDIVKGRITKAISQNLENKGLIASLNPDILIDLNVQTKEKKNYITNQIGISGSIGRRWRIGSNMSTSNTQQINQTEGTLTINLVDAAQKQLIWMGSATSIVNQKSTNQENLTKTINEILINFPPK